jgi:hypothetical protein
MIQQCLPGHSLYGIDFDLISQVNKIYKNTISMAIAKKLTKVFTSMWDRLGMFL